MLKYGGQVELGAAMTSQETDTPGADTGETSIAAITATPTTTKTANPTRGGAVPSLLRLSGVGVTRS